MDNLSLLQCIFLTQESNQGLLHCQWTYQLSYHESPTTTNVTTKKDPRDGGAWWAAIYGVAQGHDYGDMTEVTQQQQQH